MLKTVLILWNINRKYQNGTDAVVFFKISYRATKTGMAQKAAVSYISDNCETKINKVTYNQEQKPHLQLIYTINAFTA